jgi:hypothetical protein
MIRLVWSGLSDLISSALTWASATISLHEDSELPSFLLNGKNTEFSSLSLFCSLSFRFLSRLGNNWSVRGLAASSAMACTRVVGAGTFGNSFSLRSMMRAGSSIAGEILSARDIALCGSNFSVAIAVRFGGFC